jgi:hypothetical protein
MLYMIRVGDDSRWRMDLLWQGVGLGEDTVLAMELYTLH